ncbi:MAG TPA: YggT family protein [Nitrospira sp.]|jgi:YggT family protein|nr:YggT family protein [Nitrospira sp.]
MFVVGNTLLGFATILDYALTFYSWIVIARALISWVNPDPWNPIVQFLTRATEPILVPIRRRLGWGMGVDLSPLVVIVAIWFLQIAVVQSIKDFAVRMN